MKQITASSVEELETLIREHGEQALFRGQTSHYPSVTTSFDRAGCIPSDMLRWSRYAKNVLDAFQKGHGNRLENTQALLQHYGWRSFYIDCSSDPSVGAWFACHKYSENPIIEMSEDYEERPVWLRKRMAKYTFEEGDGHLYIFDKDMATQAGVVDLGKLEIDGFMSRIQAQSAWLIGPLRNAPVPIGCFIAHIVADRAIFHEYAAQNGFEDTNSLFPSPEGDPILNALLGLPWREIKGVRNDGFSIPAFRRSVELPG